jgi:hypothetical protein
VLEHTQSKKDVISGYRKTQEPAQRRDSIVSPQMPRIGISQSHKSGYHGEEKEKKRKKKKKQE